MIFSIKKVVLGFDTEVKADNEQKKKPPAKVVPLRASPDFIDYDGMGNQGRFPTRKKS